MPPAAHRIHPPTEQEEADAAGRGLQPELVQDAEELDEEVQPREARELPEQREPRERQAQVWRRVAASQADSSGWMCKATMRRRHRMSNRRKKRTTSKRERRCLLQLKQVRSAKRPPPMRF